MRALWHTLHSDLLRTTSTLTFLTRYRSIPGVERFREPAHLLGFLHGAAASPEARNAVLAALVRAAQSDAAAAEAATTTLLLALWPGLDAVHWRLARHFQAYPEEIAAEIASRVTIGICTMDPSRVHRIAATLVRNTERDIRRALTHRRREAEEQSSLADLLPPPPSDDDPLVEAARMTLSLRDWVGEDAPLIVACIVGLSQREAAETFGLGYEAAPKRYRRGLARLREALAD